MSSKLLKSYEGKLIFLYGNPNKTIEEILEKLFQSSSDNWSKDYVKLIHALKEVKLWYQKIEKLNFLSLSTFLKFYQLFQKDIYQKNDKHVLDCLNGYLILAKKQYEDKSYSGNYNFGPNDESCVSTGQLASLFCENWKEAKWICKSDNGPHDANFLKLD